MKVFVDTNILLDVLTKREPFYEHSAAIWSLVEEGIVEGYISAISVNNIFYISKKLQDLPYAQALVDKSLLRNFLLCSSVNNPAPDVLSTPFLTTKASQ